jgi:drug/metabolite transporter (DMT)-like permease
MLKLLSNETRGSLFALLSGIFYGLFGYFGMTIIEANFSVSNMLFWRFLISSITIAVLLIPKLKTLSIQWREIGKPFLAGALFYGPSSTLYFMASQYMGTGLANVILFIYLFILPLLSCLVICFIELILVKFTM